MVTYVFSLFHLLRGACVFLCNLIFNVQALAVSDPSGETVRTLLKDFYDARTMAEGSPWWAHG